MSDEADTANGPEEGGVDLTALDFGPSWARGAGKEKSGGAEPRGEKRGDHREKRGDRDQKGGRERRDGGGRERRDSGGRDDRRGGGQGRRQEGKRGDGRRFEKGGGRGRRGDDRHDRGPRREEVEPPEGVTGSVMPVEEGLDRLAKEIMAGGRTYSVFDLAKLVLGGRERFNVNFKTSGGRKLLRCRKDDSVWLEKSEAMRHFWHAEWFADFYEEVATDVPPPKGNFQAVAKCGISKEILGPPNYHGYQAAIAELHRERFAHMAIDDYKRKIVMDRGEEAVNAWLEMMSKRVKFRPTGGVRPEKTPPAPEHPEPPAEEAPAAEETPAEDTTVDEAAEETTVDEAAEEVEAGSDEAEAADISEAAEEAPAPEEAKETAPAESVPLLTDKNDVERHFKEKHFAEVFQETDRGWVPGNIPGNRLSPGLLTLLRNTVAEERRYPGKLTPMLCRQLSGRHVAVYKWRKKLKAGPSRPHPIPSDISIADRPRQLLEWVTANSGASLEKLWKALLPAPADDKTKHEWYHDLHWLLNQGYALLLSDSTIHISKKEGGAAPAKTAKKGGAAKEGGARKKGKRARRGRRRKRRVGRPGLYAWSSMTMAGEPKLQRALTASGLWPLESRMNAAGEAIPAEDEEDEGIPRRMWRDLS